MEFQTGKPEPGLFYISLVPEALRKLPPDNVELTKTLKHRPSVDRLSLSKMRSRKKRNCETRMPNWNLTFGSARCGNRRPWSNLDSPRRRRDDAIFESALSRIDADP